MWQENPSRLVGYMGRGTSFQLFDDGSSQWEYGFPKSWQSLVLTTVMFHHAYYLYVMRIPFPRLEF